MRGAAVTIAGQLGKMLIQLASVVILARMLSPHDYGLIAMVAAIIGVADIFRDFGLSSAAIQAPTLSRAERTNLFWVNSLLGFALAGIAVACAPLVALMYGEAELTLIMVALASNFLLNGLATQYRADLSRRLEFVKLVRADLTSPAIALIVAITLAANQAGYWALVAQQITQVGVMLIMVGLSARWLPGLYQRGVSVRRFVSFGTKLAISQVTGYIGNNIDSVILGLRLGPSALGLYNRSHQLVQTSIGQLRGPITNVAVPVLSRIQEDGEKFRSFTARGQIALGYTLVVALACAAGAAAPIVLLALGDQWVEATDVLRLLAIGAGFQTLSYVGYWVYVSKGLVGHLMTYNFLSVAIKIILVVIGSFYGLIGVAMAMALHPALMWPVSLWWVSRRASIPVRDLWTGGIRVVVLSTLIAAATFAVELLSRDLASWLSLVLSLLASLVTYALLVAVVPAFRRDLAGILDLYKNHLRRSHHRGSRSR